jgi:protein TonB
MMGRQTISLWVLKARRMLNGRPSRGGPVGSHRRVLLIAVVLSVLVHIMAAVLIIVLPRALPQEARPQEQGTIELLMVEQKGGKPSEAAQPVQNQPTPSPPVAPPPQKTAEAPKSEHAAEVAKPEVDKTPEAPKLEHAADAKKPEVKTPEAQTTASNAVPAPPSPEQQEELLPPQPPAPAPPKPAQSAEQTPPKPAESAEPTPPKAAQSAAQTPPQAAPPDDKPAVQQPPPQPKPQEVPVFDLAGTESESNAVALGSQILPASPDNRFRNRPPIYPLEAEVRGEHGTVDVVIHVSAGGVASSVDVVQSSGVNVLDQAAVDAVRKWRFRPALQEGRAVPFDMPFRFVFEAY